jgi:hypothetical protein
MFVNLAVGFGLLVGGAFTVSEGKDFDPLYILGTGVAFGVVTSLFLLGLFAWNRRREATRSDD